MSEEIVVRHCSPTLAGMKTGNIFSYSFANDEEMRKSMRNWNGILGSKGIRVLPLRFQNNRALVYVYRISRLSKDFKESCVRNLLKERGYETEAPGRCVVQLIKKINSSGEFPHEIGLFLGYPPEDVCGFIENGAADCKLIGTWKVYGDEEKARRTFEKYRKCTYVYSTLIAEGKSVERLTVAG